MKKILMVDSYETESNVGDNDGMLTYFNEFVVSHWKTKQQII